MEFSDSSTLVPAANPRRLLVAQGLVLLFHITGLLGLSFSQHPEFYLQFTPLTLLLSAGLLLAFQRDKPLGFWSFCVTVSLLGYLVEVIGVRTSLFFGHYQYGDTLGFKVMDVPLLIGLNWLVLTYTCGMLARYLPLPEILRVLLAALLMVGFDVCVEPLAGPYDFWHWTANIIPMQNFRDWLILAVFMQLLFSRARFLKFNALAPLVYLAQLLFFFLLGSL
jgi:putative membrane protein